MFEYRSCDARDEELGFSSSGEMSVDTSPSAPRAGDRLGCYLREIGRVPLLERDEEVAEAQKVQRYLRLLELRRQAIANGDRWLAQLALLEDLRDRLARRYPKLSLERWAAEAGMTEAEVQATLAEGRQRWAAAAGIGVEALMRTLQLGSKAKERMIRANLRLVVAVAKKYPAQGLDLADTIQEGTLGLERAVEKFDPTKGYRFSTYAYWWIRQGVTRAIATQGRAIRLPVHILEKLSKIRRVQQQFIQDRGRPATLDDIAPAVEMTPPQVREMVARLPHAVSLDLKVGKDKDTELSDLIETTVPTPEAKLVEVSLREDIEKLLDELSGRERSVIRKRYGFEDGRMQSLSEIGRALKLSRERVRQVESRALHKLQQPRRRERVRGYLESLDRLG